MGEWANSVIIEYFGFRDKDREGIKADMYLLFELIGNIYQTVGPKLSSVEKPFLYYKLCEIVFLYSENIKEGL